MGYTRQNGAIRCAKSGTAGFEKLDGTESAENPSGTCRIGLEEEKRIYCFIGRFANSGTGLGFMEWNIDQYF